MTEKQFIEKAIDGGYTNEYLKNDDPRALLGLMILNRHVLFLDPKAWQAVGKIEGWSLEDRWYLTGCTCDAGVHPLQDLHEDGCARVKLLPADRGYKWIMHHMIDALCEGKSIEQFLETL